jgi:uncharacterized protein YecE (DUF72 family)
LNRTYIGTAGWQYKDWNGKFYPPKLKQPQLQFYAEYFDTVEVNSSFYGHIKPKVAENWCKLVTDVNPAFVFTAKLNRAFTHSPVAVIEPTSATSIEPGANDEAEAKAGLDVLASAKRLGALLMQFPISFKNTEENREYLSGLAGRFSEYPLVVEVRHSTWDDPAVLREFAEIGVGFCNIDQPLLGKALAPSQVALGRIGYVRLHGRNYQQWFEHEKPHDRYNYLYSAKELENWARRIEHVSDQAETTFVISNNHFESKAAVNSLQLESMLSEGRVVAPQSLITAYPEALTSITQQPSLRLG